MHKNTLSLLALLALLLLGAKPSQAQALPTDSLVGKIVHIYFPSDGFTSLEVSNWSIPMTSEGKYWYKATLKGGIYETNQGFFFTTKDPRMFISKEGYSSGERTRFYVEDFKGQQEMWIIIDPAGPITAAPTILLEAPKTVYVLNPWISTAPVMTLATRTKGMVSSPDHCGWFFSFLLKPDEQSFYFSEINKTDTYGSAGLGSKVNFDATALTTANGANIWLNTSTNAWTGVFPNVLGDCQYLMAATVRDFSKDHPDFQFDNLTGDFLLKGMVSPTIGTDRKPVSTKIPLKAPTTYDTFDTWWNTDSTHATATMRSYESCVDIPMSKSSDGLWEYDSFRDSPTDHSFFPIETTGDHFPAEKFTSCYVKPPPDTTSWVTAGTPKRNGNFCMESHATFIYQAGQTFSFRGDDDVWVFINDKLVVDLGGVHTPKSDSVNLDKLGLTSGKEYKWDFFYCDRQACGSSLRVKTSIFFKQQRSLFKEEIVPPPPPGQVAFQIMKREGGKGSCGSVGADTIAKPATNLTLQLVDATGKVLQDLKDGVFFAGITIAVPKITVDSASIVGLDAGSYRIVVFEPANAQVRVEIPFKVPVRNLVEFEPPYTGSYPLGTLVQVIVANREKTILVPKADKYTPTLPLGLEVYGDAAKTIVIAAGTELTTDATGYDTLWVTGTAAATTDKSYLLSIPNSLKTVNLTFIVPKNRVEFEPVFTHDTLVGSLVTLITANREAGAIVAKAKDYTLNIPAGLQVFSDAAKTLAVASGAPLMTSATGYDTLWVTADSTDLIDKTYLLEIIAAPQKMTLKFHMPPLVLPSVVSASIFDDDGDGIGDRVVAVYDRNISLTPPKQIGVKWPATAAAVGTPQSEIAGKVEGGTNLVLKGQYSTTQLTSGQGLFVSVYQARKTDSTQNIPIVDKIGPIILLAEIVLGKTEDTLHIHFSEPVAVNAITVSPAELFSYKVIPTDAPVPYAPLTLTWTADRTEAIMTFTNTIAAIPHAGNLVHIELGAGHIADVAGNTAGPISLFRVIRGPNRAEIQTVTRRDIISSQILTQEPQIVATGEPTNAVIAEVVERTKRIGHLVKTDLGNFALSDDFTTIDPAQVSFEYTVSYFTNLGAFVAQNHQIITCKDAIYGAEGCLANRRYIFIGWNYTGPGPNGVKVATGAYVARIRYVVKVAGKTKETGGLDQIWGILRKD